MADNLEFLETLLGGLPGVHEVNAGKGIHLMEPWHPTLDDLNCEREWRESWVRRNTIWHRFLTNAHCFGDVAAKGCDNNGVLALLVKQGERVGDVMTMRSSSYADLQAYGVNEAVPSAMQDSAHFVFSQDEFGFLVNVIILAPVVVHIDLIARSSSSDRQERLISSIFHIHSLSLMWP